MNKKNKSTLVLVISVIVLSLVVFGLTISKTRILSNVKLLNFSFSNNKKLKGDVSNPSSNNNLSSIKISKWDMNNLSLIDTINNPNENESFVINSTSDIEYLYIEPITEVSSSSYIIKVDGEKKDYSFRLKPGNNIVEIIVTAEDNTTTKTYTLTVVKEYQETTALKNLSLAGSDLYNEDDQPTNFNPSVYTYKAIVESDEPEDYSSYINAIPLSYAGTVTIEIPQSFIFGENIYRIHVNCPNVSETVYTLKITNNKTKSNNAYLAGIFLNNVHINDYGNTFDQDVFEYSATLPDDASCEISITYTGYEGQTTEVIPAALYTCNSNFMEYHINVTSEDQTESNTYIIYIVRHVSTNTKLSSLVVKNGAGTVTYSITPDLNDNIFAYSATVPYDVDSISITAEPSDSGVSITITNMDEEEPETLKVGDNVFRIYASAGDNTSIYTLTITREGATLNKLSGLSINGYSISPNFNPDINNYTATVPYEEESIFVVAENNTQIPLTITGDGNHDLIVGQNTINIDVTPPGGTANRYTIQVTRLDNVEFDDLDIDNGIAVINEPMNVSQIKEKAGVSYNPIILDEDKNEKEDTSKVKTGDFLRIGGHDYPISLLGDYYKDGNVNLFDINALYTDYVEGTIPTDDEAKLKAGDYYKDNSVNLFDVQALYEWYLGL